MTRTPASTLAPNRAGRITVRTRLTARAVATAGFLACHLPEAPLWRLARAAGTLNYRLSSERRDLARRNLRRVVEWMDANDVGEERYRRAARDRRALDALVREAFRQHACYYLEVARAPLVNMRFIDERLLIESPDVYAEVFAERRAMIVLGMHFGAIEMPGLLVANLLGEVVAPMETVANPLVQRWLVRTRGSVGVRIVDLEHGARELAASLGRNEPVGLVSDRDINRSGTPVELFGAPAPMPRGPALLAVESGAPVYVGSVRRAGLGRYRGRISPLPVPSEGSRRERMNAFLQAEAVMFEQHIAQAPEQWWAVFSQIWPDIAPASSGAPTAERGTSGTQGRGEAS